MPNSLPANTKSKSAYHHGDLRAALIREGIRQLEAAGIADLSLRGLAKGAGVSGSAPYRHFPDKAQLLEAIAAEGYRRVAAVVAPSGVRVGEAARRMAGFADQHPAWWELMVSGGPPVGAELEEARGGLLAELVGAVERSGSGAGHAPDEAIRIAVAVWALVVGLARLRASGGVVLLDEGMVPDPAALAEELVSGRSTPRAGVPRP